MLVVNGRDSGRNAWAAAPAKSPRASSVEKARPATVAGRIPRAPNAAMRERMAGHPQQRGEHRGCEIVPAAGGPADVPRPGPAVLAQALHRVVDRPVEHAGAAIVERVHEGDVGMDQLEAVSPEVGRLEERRHRGQRVDRRAHVVDEARQGERRAAGPATDGVGALEDEHGTARRRARDRGGQPVRTGAHHDDVDHVLTLRCAHGSDDRRDPGGRPAGGVGGRRLHRRRRRLLPRRHGPRPARRARWRQADPGLVVARHAHRPARRRAARRPAHHRVRRRRPRTRPSTPTGPPTSTTSCCSPLTCPAPPRPSVGSGSSPAASGTSDTYGAPMKQVFFRLGEVILELIGQPGSTGEGAPGLLRPGDHRRRPRRAGRAARRAPRDGQGCGPGGPPDRHPAPSRPGDVGRHGVHVTRAGLARSATGRSEREPVGGAQHPAGAGAEHGAAAAAGDGQDVATGGGEGTERPLATELAAAADGAVGEGHGSIVRARGSVAKAVIPGPVDQVC